MRRLNLDQLRAVTEVMRLGSFSAAARSLNLTQPAISFQVRELEERLGLQLIERLGKRAYPTPAGTELIEYARRIDRDVDDAMQATRGRARSRTSRHWPYPPRLHVAAGAARAAPQASEYRARCHHGLDRRDQ